MASINSAIAGSTNSWDIKKLGDARDRLSDALDNSSWLDASHLAAKDGDKVFNSLKNAAQTLNTISGSNQSALSVDTIQGWLSVLVNSARIIAQNQIDDSTGTPGANAAKLADAANEMANAQQDIVAGRLPQAIDRYRNAWKLALNAIK